MPKDFFPVFSTEYKLEKTITQLEELYFLDPDSTPTREASAIQCLYNLEASKSILALGSGMRSPYIAKIFYLTGLILQTNHQEAKLAVGSICYLMDLYLQDKPTIKTSLKILNSIKRLHFANKIHCPESFNLFYFQNPLQILISRLFLEFQSLHASDFIRILVSLHQLQPMLGNPRASIICNMRAALIANIDSTAVSATNLVKDKIIRPDEKEWFLAWLTSGKKLSPTIEVSCEDKEESEKNADSPDYPSPDASSTTHSGSPDEDRTGGLVI